MALVLVLLTGVFEVSPARASAETKNETVSNLDFLNEDGTLKLGENTSGAFQAENWDVQLDSEHGPIFSPKHRESLSPLATTTIDNWSALGGNLAGTDGALSHPSIPYLRAITVSGTDIYVGGCFLDAGGDPTADYVARWDGTSWHGLGNDGANPADGAVKACVTAIAVDGSNVYVAHFGDVYIGGAAAPQANSLAKWNGTSWSGVGGDGAGGSSFGSGPNNYINSLQLLAGNLYVGGVFTNVKNGSTTLANADFIAKWDGTNWSALGSNVQGDGAVAGDASVNALAVIGNDLYVGGVFAIYNAQGQLTEATSIAKWDGTQWSSLGYGGDPALAPGPVNGIVNALAADGTNLYVGGNFTSVNNYETPLSGAKNIVKWDGANWSALGSDGNGNGSTSNGDVQAIAVIQGNVYVGGKFTNVNNNGAVLPAADYVAKWDGTNWSSLGTNGSGNGSLNDWVFALGKVGDTLYVGGKFTNVNNNGTVLSTADYIASYDSCSSSITVQNTNDLGAGSLRQAIADVCSGGTINFAPSLSGETIYLASTLILSQNVTINGSALAMPITISGDSDNNGTGDVRVFHTTTSPGTFATMTLDSLIITKGLASGPHAPNRDDEGGGLLIDLHTTTNIINSLFSGNSANNGGAISVYGTANIIDSTFSGSSSTNGAGGGGAILNSQILTINNSTFSNNTADNNGGGGALFNTSPNATIANSTFSGNSAGIGGAITTTSDLTITNSTISGNSAYGSSGGGLTVQGHTTNLINTIIGNSITRIGGIGQAGDCLNFGSIGTNLNNLIQDGSCSPSLSGDPKLGPLADNGGPTQTFALLPGSFGINSGNDASCPGTDQRGVTRPQGHHCDIGAYEYDSLGGPDTVGVFRPSNGALFLRNSNTTGFANIAINYGLSGDYPVVGDWDGNGTDTIGVYRNGVFYLRNSNTLGFANNTVAFGSPGDQPIAGDWNNDGFDTIGVYRSSTGTFMLRNSNTAGPADLTFALGNAGDVGIAGDWNGDGIDTTGVFRPSNGMIFLKNTNASGFANIALNYGLPGDQPVVGDWDNDGKTTIGIYRNARFYLRNSNTNGFANIILDLGNVGDMPIAGDWDGKP